MAVRRRVVPPTDGGPDLVESRLETEATVNSWSDYESARGSRVGTVHLPDLLGLYQKHYPQGSYAPAEYRWRRIALRIRELCAKYGIRDRIPRPIIPGDKRALNKRIVAALADKTYEMKLQNAANYRVWAYRKAAWAVEDLEQDIGLVYQMMGLKGLQSIPNVGESIGKVIEKMLNSG